MSHSEPMLRTVAEGVGIQTAMGVFTALAEAWGLSTDEQIKLLGSPARSTYFKWKKDGGNLPNDTIERISHLLGIYKCLEILLPKNQAADTWLKKTNLYFDDQSALEIMMSGQFVDIYKVREYLDAQRGG